MWWQVGAHTPSVHPSKLSGRAVGVSQQQFLSLEERGRGSSPVPVWAPPLITGEDVAELGASELHGSGDPHTLAHSFNSTIISRLGSSPDMCRGRTLPRGKAPEEREVCSAQGGGFGCTQQVPSGTCPSLCTDTKC